MAINWRFWRPRPAPSLSAGDSSRIETGNTNAPSGRQTVTPTPSTPQLGSPNTSGGSSSNSSSNRGGSGGSSNRNRNNGGDSSSLYSGSEPAPNIQTPNKVEQVNKNNSGLMSSKVSTSYSKLSAQVNKNIPTENRINEAPTLTKTQATIQSGKNIASNVGAFFTGKSYTDWDRPFTYVGKEETYYGKNLNLGTDTKYKKPVFGTQEIVGFNMDSNQPIYTGTTKDVTFFEVESEKKFDYNIKAGGVTKKYQGKVNEYTTERELAEINKQYQEEQKDLFESYNFEPTVRMRSGAKIPNQIRAGTDVIVGASTLIPGTQAVTVPLATGYFGGKGLLQATAKPSYEDAFSDISYAWKDTIEGKQTDDTMLNEYKNLRTNAALNLGLGIGGGATAGIKSIGNEINALRVTELSSANSRTIGTIAKQGDDELLKVYTASKTGTGRQFLKGQFDIIKKEGTEFSLGAGKGKVKTQVLDFWKQGTPEFGADPFTRTTRTFTAAARGNVDDAIIGGNTLADNVKGFRGEGYFAVSYTHLTLPTNREV